MLDEHRCRVYSCKLDRCCATHMLRILACLASRENSSGGEDVAVGVIVSSQSNPSSNAQNHLYVLLNIVSINACREAKLNRRSSICPAIFVCERSI